MVWQVWLAGMQSLHVCAAATHGALGSSRTAQKSTGKKKGRRPQGLSKHTLLYTQHACCNVWDMRGLTEDAQLLH